MLHRIFVGVFISLFLFPLFTYSLIGQEISSKQDNRIKVKMEGSDSFAEFGYAIIRSFEKVFGDNDILTQKDTISTMQVILNIREIDNEKAAVSVLILDPMRSDSEELNEYKKIEKDYLKILTKNEVDEFTASVAKDYKELMNITH